MTLDQPMYFSPFCLDPCHACLWRGAERIALIPKDFAILSYLATHPYRVVPHPELLTAVWGETIVSRGVLKVHLHRIRQALGDTPQAPRFIETVPRYGYRFIAPLTSTPALTALSQSPTSCLHATLRELQSAFAAVDQETNDFQLHEWLEDLVCKVRSLATVSQPQLPHAA